MTMRKYLLLFLGLVFVASITQAKIVNDTVYQIPKTKIAPTIDGIEDAVWKTLDWNLQRTYSVGDPPAPTDSGAGLSGMSKAMWDANNMYILFYSVDDVILEVPGNTVWNQDAIELYFDADNSKTPDGVAPDPGGGLAPGDWQFTIPHIVKGNEALSHALCFGTAFDSTGVEFIVRDVEDTEGFPGWICEVKIPLENLGIDGSGAGGSLIGFELQQDEADDATTGRKGMSKWWHYSNNSWTNAALWGNALLSTREVDSTLVINKTTATIVMDGVMDAAYKNAHQVTTNLFRVGDPPANQVSDTDPLNSFVTAYPLYDASYYYVFFDVNDAIITNVAANTVWNQDAIEFYIDTDNSKTPDGVAPDPGGGRAPGDIQLTFTNIFKGDETGHWLPIGVSATGPEDTTGWEFKVVDKPEGGYYVELKLTWTGLGVDPAEGTMIGFEVQMDNSNDATAGRQGMQKWWHNSNNSWTDASLWGTAKLGPVVNYTSVSKKNPSVASEYQLGQNYPNPFNPSTKIDYTIAKSGLVKLTVYNLLGKEIATLVNGVKQAGIHSANFNAANLASGVYFYKLQAGNTILTNKMVLLK